MSKESIQKEDDLFARVRAQVMVRDDGKGGWVPLGQGGMSSVGLISFSRTEASNATADLCIQGCRLSDRSTILRCPIRKDLQYTKANPTFHHWRSDSARFGLTFQSASEARTFEKNLKRSISLLKHGMNDRMGNSKSDKTKIHARHLQKLESFSRADSTTSTTISSPTLTSPPHHIPSPTHPLSPNRLSSPTPPSCTPAHTQSSFSLVQTSSGSTQQTSTDKRRNPVENLKSLLSVNIFHKNEKSNNASLPKPWCYFTFPPFYLRSKEEKRERNASLPGNFKILTSANDQRGANKPLLLPHVLPLNMQLRHSVSGVGCREDEKAPLKLLPSCQQLLPGSHHSSSSSSRRRFEIFGRMTSKLMTLSSVSCPSEARKSEDRPSTRHPSVPNPPCSSLPAMAGWSVTEKRHPHHPSTLHNFPPPFLLQPSSSSSSIKNYGTIFSESEFALRLSSENAARERCRFCNEEFSSTSNFTNSCQQAPDRVSLWIERVSCCFLARPFVHHCCLAGHVDEAYKRQESSEGSEEGARWEGCDSRKWASWSALVCFSLAMPCLCLYWPLTCCHFAAVRCGCCGFEGGGRHESV